MINKRVWTLWFTGLHGSGKTTITNSLVRQLRKKNIPVVVLDGDEVRKNISSDLGYSLEERNKHLKRVAGMCKIINTNGILCIAAVASPTESSRKYAKKLLDNFFLAYIKCPLEICKKRDVKGHYKKAALRKPGFKHFSKGTLDFEEPKSPDIILETNKESKEDSVNKLISKLKEKGIIWDK